MAVHLSQRQARLMADTLLAAMAKEGYLNVKLPQESLAARLESVLLKNISDEVDLENQARQVIDKNSAQIGAEMDQHKLFLMIKKQLAKEKGFVL